MGWRKLADVTFAPITEELVVRGVLFGSLVAVGRGNRVVVLIAAVATAAYWTLGHLHQWEGQTAIRMGLLLMDGTVLAMVAHRFSLGTAILTHAFANALNFPMAWLFLTYLVDTGPVAP